MERDIEGKEGEERDIEGKEGEERYIERKGVEREGEYIRWK